MESDLHKLLKKAVCRKYDGCYVRTEERRGAGGDGYFVVDVYVSRNSRYYYFECETRPSMKRLMEKGEKRKGHLHRNTYTLVVPAELYPRHDWGQLRGYFDAVWAYDAEDEAFTHIHDLRLLGGLRDAALDIIMPLKRSYRYLKLRWVFKARYFRLKVTLWSFVQCAACKLGVRIGGEFCPRHDCPDSED